MSNIKHNTVEKFKGFLASRVFIFIALIILQVVVIISFMSMLEEISTLIQTILRIISIFVVIWITNQPKNPAYKIGWAILIVGLPVFGMTMYFFFSQRKLSEKEIRKGIETLESVGGYCAPKEQPRDLLKLADEGAVRQSDYINHSSLYPLYKNTETKYYPMGEDFFEDLILELEQAKHYIFMEYFIVKEGIMWGTILDILERKAAEGLDVRFMYDDIGCINTLPYGYDKQLQEKGIDTIVFNPLRPVLNSLFNNRDHRKITIIDGHTGFCGGANIADEYINEIDRFGVWKDAQIRLKGEGVQSLMMIFLHLWSYSLEDDEANIRPIKVPKVYDQPVRSDGFVQPFADSPFDDTYLNESIFINMIARAKDYIYINTPYLILGNELITVLRTAAKSGVDVRITVPHIPDKKIVFLVTQANYPQLIEAGVKIYEYTPGFMHSKTILCDDKYAVVGTANLDFRSLYLHFECGVWMYNSSCIEDMKSDYLETIDVSKKILYADTQNIPWYKRFMQAIFRIFGPLM